MSYIVGNSRRSGFTLLELMIVIAVIAIITAIAIPSLINSRMSANESSAISSLRTLTTVNEQYNVRFQSYAPAMGDLDTAGYTYGDLPTGAKSGYTFSYTGTQYTFSCNAAPILPGTTGNNYYFVDQSGVIRDNNTSVASSSDGPIGGS